MHLISFLTETGWPRCSKRESEFEDSTPECERPSEIAGRLLETFRQDRRCISCHVQNGKHFRCAAVFPIKDAVWWEQSAPHFLPKQPGRFAVDSTALWICSDLLQKEAKTSSDGLGVPFGDRIEVVPNVCEVQHGEAREVRTLQRVVASFSQSSKKDST